MVTEAPVDTLGPIASTSHGIARHIGHDRHISAPGPAVETGVYASHDRRMCNPACLYQRGEVLVMQPKSHDEPGDPATWPRVRVIRRNNRSTRQRRIELLVEVIDAPTRYDPETGLPVPPTLVVMATELYRESAIPALLGWYATLRRSHELWKQERDEIEKATERVRESFKGHHDDASAANSVAAGLAFAQNPHAGW